MWPARRILPYIGLALLVLLGALTALGTQLPGSAPLPGHATPYSAGNATTCDAQYHPIADCAVPSGGTLDPCSTVSAGRLHCGFTLPDFNPSDWLQWFLCQIGASAAFLWSTIQSFVASFILSIVNAFLNAIVAGFNSILNALLVPILAGISGLQTLALQAVNTIASISTAAGPLAPIVDALLLGALLAAAMIGLYFASAFLFAAGKTLFNLL